MLTTGLPKPQDMPQYEIQYSKISYQSNFRDSGNDYK